MAIRVRLTVSQRAKAADLYERLSGDSDALEEFIYLTIGREETIADVLDEIEEYLEGRQDVVDGSYGVPHPNREMQLLTALQEARARTAK